jgi:AcrR family transcriptional regulator
MFYTVLMSSSSPDEVPDKESSASEPRRPTGPAVVAPPRPPRRPRPGSKRPSLSVDTVVQAAIDVLDEAGVAGLSMRRVAEHLNTGVGSLYAHVSSKEELLELVYDALVGQVALPEPDAATWRGQVHRMLGDLRDILASHADAALAGLGRIPTSPQTLAAAETLSAVLRAGGLTDPVIALGLDQLVLYVSACAFEAGLYRQSMDTGEMERYIADVHAFYSALPADRYPVLAAIAPDMIGHDAAARFEFGLDVILAGLIAQSRGKTPPGDV